MCPGIVLALVFVFRAAPASEVNGAEPMATDEHGDTPLDLVRHAPDEVRDLLEASAGACPRNHPGLLPAGTRLTLPRWVKAQFELEKQNWTTAFDFLFARFSVSERSLLDKRKFTSYVPLVRGDGPDQETIMVDIMNIRGIDTGKWETFVTLGDTETLSVPPGITRHLRNCPPDERSNQP